MGTERLTDDVLEKIEYHVVHSQDALSTEGRKLYSRLQAYWEKSWLETFKLLKSSETLNPEDFTMQDRITALILGDEIIGMHLLKDYSEKDFNSHRYFQNYYNQNFINELKKLNVKRVQSFQYFWVDPNWSKKKTGINFAAIVASLSFKYQIEGKLDASITVARKDNSAYAIACGFGFDEIAVSTMHNVPVAQMICRRPMTFPDVLVAKYADYYWKNKTEYKSEIIVKKSA